MWSNLLALRPLIQTFVVCKLGNGNQASFWYDKWTTSGPLFDLLGESGPMYLGIPFSAKVADAISNTSWNVREARTDQALAIHAELIATPLPLLESEEDVYNLKWEENASSNFSAAKFWDYHRFKESRKWWAAMIWFKGCTPKHAFLMWVTNYDRLPLRTRLRNWGMNVPTTCCLSDEGEETRDHLFLRCTYSEIVWGLVLVRLRQSFAGFHSWNALMHWGSTPTATAKVLLKRLVSQATIYSLWRERNERLHALSSTPPEVIFKSLDRLIRDTILSRRSKRGFYNLMIDWLPR